MGVPRYSTDDPIELAEHDCESEDVALVEHYTAASYDDRATPETYEEVAFTWDGGEAHEPQWRRLQGKELVHRL